MSDQTGKSEDRVRGEQAYRVDATSNYNSEAYAEKVKLNWLTKSQADRIADILNEGCDGSPTFYEARPHGSGLWRGIEEMI